MTRPETAAPTRAEAARRPTRDEAAANGRPPEPDDARAAALELLTAVREDGAYANLALPRILAARGLSGRDAALATDLAYGSCRALGLLDAIIGRCSDRPLDTLDGAVHDALRLGTYQLLRTRIPPHAAVSTTVDLVLAGPRPGAAGFVNAVLRKVAEHDEDSWVAPDRAAAGRRPGRPPGRRNRRTRVGSPRRSTMRSATAGDELEAALRADDERPRVHLVARPGRIDRDELLAEIADRRRPSDKRSDNRAADYSPYGVYLDEGDPGRIAAVVDGRAAVQDEGSQLVALALAAAPIDGPDERWLDLAAGPGGKAGLLGAIAAQRGAVLDAVEVSAHRAELVRQTVRGLPVTVHVADGRDPGLDPGFDRVLLDAPCTGLGALRRRPDARWRRSPADVDDLVDAAAAAAGQRRGSGPGRRRHRLRHLLTAPGRDRRCGRRHRRGLHPGRRPAATCPGCRTWATGRPCSSGRTGTAPTACSSR